MAVARNLVNLKDVDKGYGSRSVLRDVTLGVSAGRPDRRRRAQRRRQVDAAAADRRRRGGRRRRGDARRATSSWRCSARATSSTPRRRSAASWSAGAPTTSGPPTRASASVLDGLLGGVDVTRFPHGLDTSIAPLSRRRAAADRARHGCCSTAPSCCCSTSRPTTSTSRASTGWPGTSRRGAGRCWSSPTTAGSWTPSAPRRGRSPTTTVHQYEGGYAAYVLARAERDRQAASREERRQQLLRKELAWLRRGPPARTSQAEVPHRGRQRADRRRAARPATAPSCCASPRARLGDKVLDAEDVTLSYGDRPVLRRVTWRLGPGDRVALVGRQRLGQDDAAEAAGRRRSRRRGGSVERGPTVRARPALAGHGRDPRPPARARVAGGGARARDARRRPGDHRGAAGRPLRLPRRPRPDAGPRPVAAASAAGCS